MSAAQSIRERVMQAIALNREPGFHFAGNFLQISFDRTDPADTHVHIDTGPHCIDREGHVNIGVVGILADMALAASIRGGMDPSTRLATVGMSLQFSGKPAKGDLHAASQFEGFFESGHSRQGQSRVVLQGGAGPVCHGHAAFIALEPPPGFRLFPMPSGERSAPPIPEAELTREERALLRHAEALLAEGSEDFLARFWGYSGAHRKAHGASCLMKNGPHVANRVHHVQGGILVGLAATTAATALPASWSLTGLTACFTSPGQGRGLRAASKIVHQGLMTAVVRTEISGAGRRRILEMLSTHSRVTR